ncbi:MAG TPA: hypothetical protein VK194_11065 [Candidatus Deferrimicrobium sp.]|nr:hypothetical protein [Candidatus Deferrimicrobium sp.]
MTMSSPRDQRNQAMQPADERRVGWLVVGIVAAPVAVWAFNQGVTDWQYQLAGLANPFLGRPAPGWSIAIGLVGTAVFGVVAWIVRTLARSLDGQPGSGASARGPAWTRPRWWLPLAAGWIAYALGSAAGAAGGGPRTYEATMRFAFGPPIAAAVEVPARCTTPVGKPAQVAEVEPRPEGLFRLTLLNAATGARSRYPEPTGVFAELVGTGAAATAYPLPNVPARVLPYLQATSGDGSTRSEPPIGILKAYDYRVVRVDDRGTSGTVDILGTRFGDPGGGGSAGNVPGSLRWVNLVIPDDPWPHTLAVTVSWSCADGAGSAQR